MLETNGENIGAQNGNCHAVAGSKVREKNYKLVPFLSPFPPLFPLFSFPL